MIPSYYQPRAGTDRIMAVIRRLSMRRPITAQDGLLIAMRMANKISRNPGATAGAFQRKWGHRWSMFRGQFRVNFCGSWEQYEHEARAAGVQFCLIWEHRYRHIYWLMGQEKQARATRRLLSDIKHSLKQIEEQAE